MQPRLRIFLLPTAIGLWAGCAGPAQHLARGSGEARYGWLRRQGMVQAPLPSPANRRSESDRAWQLGHPPVLRSPAPPELTVMAPSNEKRLLATRPREQASQALAAPLPHWQAPASILQPDSTDYYSTEPGKWSVLAFTSATLAAATLAVGISVQSLLVLFIGGVAAFIIGLVASRRCRDRQERGKALALIGMVLGGATLFFSLMALLLTS